MDFKAFEKKHVIKKDGKNFILTDFEYVEVSDNKIDRYQFEIAGAIRCYSKKADLYTFMMQDIDVDEVVSPQTFDFDEAISQISSKFSGNYGQNSTEKSTFRPQLTVYRVNSNRKSQQNSCQTAIRRAAQLRIGQTAEEYADSDHDDEIDANAAQNGKGPDGLAKSLMFLIRLLHPFSSS